jgi:tetratricopeptide (TPR) repeat protein
MPERLESWKEIAAHLGRRVRTVQRWEKDEGLPVHRLAHRRRGTVYALSHELDAWWAQRSVRPALESSPVEAIPEEVAPSRARRWAAAGGMALLAVAALALLPSRGAPGSAPAGGDDPQRVLTARYLLHRGGEAEARRAVALCSQPLLAGEGREARAAIHECLAQGALALVRTGALPRYEGIARVRREAEAALALDPRRPDAITIAARTRFFLDWDFAAAEDAYRRAIAFDPGAASAHHALAGLLSLRGRHDEAIAELRLAQRSAPLSAAINDDGCWYFYRARRPRQAIAEAERALLLEPGRSGALECIVDSRAALGEHGAAREAAVAMLRTLGDPAAEEIAAAPAVEARPLLERRLLARLADERRPVPAMPFAMRYAALGERDAAMSWLEQALADHDPVLLLVRVHPAFDSLRGDPRLEPLLRRAGV